MSDKCQDCKWYVSSSENCLLGRDLGKCTMAPARRGDDDLFGRMMEMSEQEFAEVRDYFRRRK